MSKNTVINLSIYVVLLLVLWLGLKPLFADNNQLKLINDDLSAKITSEQELQDKIGALVEEINSKEEELTFLDLAILPYRDVASAIVIFEEASLINGLALSEIGVSDVSLSDSEQVQQGGSEELPGLGVLLFDLELSGKYPSFVTFLKDIEETFPLMDISDIQFKLKSEDATETEEGGDDLNLNPTLGLSISLETYYRQ